MKMRMVWWREAKWLLASYVLDFFLWLTEREASAKMIGSIYELCKDFESDPKFQTVPMRAVRP